jgi:hypothetical protein
VTEGDRKTKSWRKKEFTREREREEKKSSVWREK